MPENDINKFNPTVHVADEHGDPKRKENGEFRLKPNWKEVAVDRQGRRFNPKIHDEKLDGSGYLIVRRRSSVHPITDENHSEAFVKKHREEGYAYYLMNDEGGRMEKFLSNDWEPVTTPNGRAEMPVGQARGPNTKAVLMRKPLEWYEEDQRRKRKLRDADYKQTTAPKEDQGQYEAVQSSPLR